MRLLLGLTLGVLFSIEVGAQPQVVMISDAWVPPTPKGQSSAPVFMRLMSPEKVFLLGASSPAASLTELHETKIESGGLRMRALAKGLELPAGRTLEFNPDSYHLMLVDLISPLKAGQGIPLEMSFRTLKGQEFKMNTIVSVGRLRPGQSPQVSSEQAQPTATKP